MALILVLLTLISILVALIYLFIFIIKERKKAHKFDFSHNLHYLCYAASASILKIIFIWSSQSKRFCLLICSSQTHHEAQYRPTIAYSTVKVGGKDEAEIHSKSRKAISD